MHKLFLGNLQPYVSTVDVTDLLNQHKLNYIGVQVRSKIGAAFIDFGDQNAADRAIDCLNGIEFHGLTLKIEPSVPRRYHNNNHAHAHFTPGPGYHNQNNINQNQSSNPHNHNQQQPATNLHNNHNHINHPPNHLHQLPQSGIIQHSLAQAAFPQQQQRSFIHTQPAKHYFAAQPHHQVVLANYPQEPHAQYVHAVVPQPQVFHPQQHPHHQHQLQSVPKSLSQPTSRIQIRNLPQHTDRNAVAQLAQPFGKVTLVERDVTDISRGVAYVTYATRDQAIAATQQLNGKDFAPNCVLKVNLVPMATQHQQQQQGAQQHTGPAHAHAPRAQHNAHAGHAGNNMNMGVAPAHHQQHAHAQVNGMQHNAMQNNVNAPNRRGARSVPAQNIGAAGDTHVMQGPYNPSMMMRAGQNGAPGGPQMPDMPLRMIVDARHVGAIIGQGGANIREITKDSKARCVVDVNRGQPREQPTQSGTVEKVINIFGQADNCTKACLKIMDVVLRERQREMAQQDGVEPELKLRAHNQLVGRLIGKNGVTIKKIMDDTQCTVFVSNFSINELSPFNMERTITIRGGSNEQISKAEHQISAKLRQCWEQDMNSSQRGGAFAGASGQPIMSNAAGVIMPMAGAAGMGYASVQPGMAGADGQMAYPLSVMPYAMQGQVGAQGSTAGAHLSASGMVGGAPMMAAHRTAAGGLGQAGQMLPPVSEQVTMWVPNNIVGALIGTKGTHIRSIMRQTGAQIRIEAGPPAAANADKQNTEDKDKDAGGSPSVQASEEHSSAATAGAGAADDRRVQESLVDLDEERQVTILGMDAQQYKAQFWIYSRICEHTYSFFDEVRLTSELHVPTKLVGRIIGKGGQNVRELQRVTGATVKIPEDATDGCEQTLVRIHGNFHASQHVQGRIRQLMQQYRAQHGHSSNAIHATRSHDSHKTDNHKASPDTDTDTVNANNKHSSNASATDSE